MAKIVSAEFREKKTSSMPKNTLNLDSIIDTYRTEARWDKAVPPARQRISRGHTKGHRANHGMAGGPEDVEEEEKGEHQGPPLRQFRSRSSRASLRVAQWYKDGLAVAGEPQRADLVSPEGQDA